MPTRPSTRARPSSRTRRPPAAADQCCPAPRIAGDRVHMDWRRHKTWETPQPCRVCKRGAICRDCTGGPCHKTCAELELARDIRLGTHTPKGH